MSLPRLSIPSGRLQAEFHSHQLEDPCGLHAEYAEEGMASQPHQGNGSRVRSWEAYLAQKPELQDRIAAKTRWHPSWIPGRIEALHEHLVSQHGSEAHIAGDAVTVREGAVTPDQMSALRCIAEEHMVEYDVQYLPQHSGHMQLDRRA